MEQGRKEGREGGEGVRGGREGGEGDPFTKATYSEIRLALNITIIPYIHFSLFVHKSKFQSGLNSFT